MSIFGTDFRDTILEISESTNFLTGVTSITEAFNIIDHALVITDTSGVGATAPPQTLSEVINVLQDNINNINLNNNSNFVTISELQASQLVQDTSISQHAGRIDQAEMTITEHNTLISDNATAIANHIVSITAHDGSQINFIGNTSVPATLVVGDNIDTLDYTNIQDYHPTNRVKNVINFNNKILSFMDDGPLTNTVYISSDGGQTFSIHPDSTINTQYITAQAVGIYQTLPTLFIGSIAGQIYKSTDGLTFTAFNTISNSNGTIHGLSYSTLFSNSWLVVTHAGVVYWWDDTTVETYLLSENNITSNSIHLSPLGYIVGTPSGAYYGNFAAGTILTTLPNEPIYVSGDENTCYAITESGVLYSSDLNTVIMDNFVQIGTITGNSFASGIHKIGNKYIITQLNPIDGDHVYVWFNAPFTNFSYQTQTLPVRSTFGACQGYLGGGMGPIDILVENNTGIITCPKVTDAIVALNTANTEMRAAGYQTAANVNTTLTNYATTTDLATKYDASNPSGYQTAANVNTTLTNYATTTDLATKYDASNPNNFITSSALTPYVLSVDASNTYATIANLSTKYDASNPNNFITSSALTPYLLSVDASNTYATSNYVNTTLNDYLLNTTAATTYKSISSFNSDIANYRTSANQDIITGYLARNIRVVDAIHGVSAPVLGQAYSSIVAALTGFSGGTIFLYPGTHVITNTIQPIANVSFLGADKKTTIIQYTATSSSSMFLINAANISFQNLTINMISSSAVDLKMFEITANNNTFHMDNCLCNITQTSTGTSNIYGIYDTGTDQMTSDAQFHIFEMVNIINTTATGIVRNIYKNPSSGTGGDLHIESSQFYTNSGICVESAGANSPELSLTNCFIQGATSDISQTTGRITLGKGTVLFSANSNNLPFNFFGSAQSWQFGDDGQLPGGTNYLYRGTATSSATLVPYRINKPTIVCNLYVNQRLAPGAGQNVVYTLMKNGAATSLTCTVSNTATTNNDILHAITFAAGDNLAMRTNNSGGTSADVIVQIDLY